MKRVALYILFLLINLNLNAQVVYPIRSYTILQPPLPYNLNGFVSEPGKINLNIIVDDVDLDQYAVKFRLHMEGNGIKLTTRPDFYQQPYYLEGAGTHTLTGFDLEDILNPDNLIFEGYSRNQYKKTGRLPEGVYRIWVDVYDYYRNIKVSMSSPGIAMIFLAKAPRLSFPLNQTEIDSDVMQNIRFSWFSILPADPLADVRYRFKLFEIRPDGRDPYEITRVTQPIYQEETNQSSFVYDLSMPPLISGMSYAWKVEAYDLENRVLFQNDGHSDVLSFRYGKSCEIPELSIKEVKSKSVSLSWITDVAATEYTLAYKRTKDETWQEEKTDLLKYTLNDLDDNSGYQIKIKARCGDSETGFSRIQELKTTREVNYACGNKSDNFDLSNTEPLASLGRFDEFKAADFIVEVEEVLGGNGNFTGKGYALVPYLGFLKFRVEFENIFVNSDSRMTSGEIKFVYDEVTGMIIGENAGGEEEDDTVNVNDELEEISNKVIVSDTDITTVTVNGGNVVITHTDGTSETVAIGDSKVISVTGGDNDSGNAYVVDAGSGQVFTTPKKVAGGGKGSSAVGTGSQTGEYGCSVSFSKASMQRYGFDQIGDGVNKPDSYFLKSKTGELIDWKSLESGSTDFVNINVNGTCSADSLRYLRESGLLTPSAPNKKGRQLLLTGLSEGEEDILSVAVAKTKMGSDSSSREILTLAGALGLVSYDRISKDVVLVPVNGAQCPDNIGLLGKELNDIYGPAVVNWNVSIEKNLEVEAIKGKVFEHSGTGTLSKYTSDMREVINEFKDERDHDRHTVYLFFINENTATKTGFMPLASEYGFIFNFRTETHVIAHELGHSKDFNLRHTFSEKAQHFFPERSTKNLMDYAGGSELWKYQWDLIHNPEKIFFAWAQDEKEGAFESYEYLAGKNVVSGSFKEAIGLSASSGLSFVSRAGWVITIPSNAVDVTFNDNGTLMGFTITEDGKQERYVGAQYTKGEDAGKFAGFLKEFGSFDDHQEKIYKDEISKDLEGSGTNVYFGIINSGNSDSPCEIYLFEGEYPLSDISGNYNTGGNNQPKVSTETIKGKLLSTYTDNNVSVPSYGDKIKYLTSVKSEHACNNCEKGKTFYEEYESTATDEESKYFLTKVSQLICDNESEIVDYKMLKKQINWDYQRLLINSIWNTDKTKFKIARQKFWDLDNAWELYFQALNNTENKIKYYNELLGSEISEDDFRLAVYYLNDDFLATLTIAERVDLIAFIFEHNFFINEKWFLSETSDVSLITKIVKTLNSEDLSLLMSALIQVEDLFIDDNRDVLFEVINGTNKESLRGVTLDLKLHALRHLLGGSLSNVFGATNYQAVITKIIGSIKDENATKFFTELRSTSKYLVDDKPLLFSLRNKLRDFLNSQDSYTEFFKEIKRLSDARYIQEKGSLEITKAIVWDVKNVDAVLISYVKNSNDFDFVYNEDNQTVSISTCVKSESRYTPGLQGYGTTTTECLEVEDILPEGTNPFDLIGITIINDISPFAGGCNNGQGEYGYCGKMFYIPAIFVNYLEQNLNTQRWKNFGWNTFNVVITVTTLGEGVAAVTAIRTAEAGTQLAVASKHAYTLLDFTFTVTDITLSATGVDKPDWWQTVNYLFQARTAFDLINKGGAKCLAYLKKSSPSEKRRIIEELGLKKNGVKLSEVELDEYIRATEQKISLSSKELIEKYKGELEKIDEIYDIGKTVDDLLVAPNGYEFYYRNGRKWIRRLKGNKDKFEYPRLTVKDGKISRYAGEELNQLTQQYVDDFTYLATRNKTANKIMLGKYDLEDISYNIEAGTDYVFFELDNWDDVYKMVNESDAEMWRINKKFLDNQFDSKKEFYFSHDPNSASGFFKEEVDYLKEQLGAKEFIKEGKYWKVIWK